MSTDAATPESPPLVCRIARLPTNQIVQAARIAIQERPENSPYVGPETGPLRQVLRAPLPPAHAAVLTSKYWGKDGAAALTVGFLDGPSAQLQTMILQYANMWGKRANVKFVPSNVSPLIRITRTLGEGYYSYLGTDCKSVPAGQNTMNLDSFTIRTPISEFLRVVCHEFGHGLGLIHEHSRKEIEGLINPALAYPYFLQDQGWDHQTVDDQVLVVQDESEVLLESEPDPTSIMCYDIPGQITYDGKGITGGVVINDNDYDTIGILYPLADA